MTTRSPVGRRLHLAATVVLALAIAVFVGLAAVGVLEVRAVGNRAGQPPAGDAEPAGPWVERIDATDPSFEMLGQKAHVYRYGGGPVDCWLAVDAGGRQTDIGAELGAGLRKLATVSDGASPVADSGYILWVRRKDGGAEVWDLAIAITGPDGKVRALNRQSGITPPPPAREGTMWSEGSRVGGRQRLEPGREVDLYAVRNFAGLDGPPTRTTTLRCRAAATATGR